MFGLYPEILFTSLALLGPVDVGLRRKGREQLWDVCVLCHSGLPAVKGS